MSEANGYYTMITIFFAPFGGKGSVRKFWNNRYPLTGRKVKKLLKDIRTKYPGAERVWVHVFTPYGVEDWAFRGQQLCRQSLDLNLKNR
jgi:hypothetical protein